MNNLQKKIIDIQGKLEKFVLKYQSSEERLSESALKIKSLNEKIKEQDEKIVYLESRIEKLRMAKTLGETGEDPANVRTKINELIRGIDRCIAQLNQ
mgnify:CR=1 FL=1